MSAVVEKGSGRILAWKDGIPLHYEYTAGAAGEVFLRGLKEGRIIASKCTTCGEVRVPPRTYCLECGARTRIDVELLQSGRLAAVTTGGGGEEGARSRSTFGFVTFEGVGGGLKVGDAVTPSFLDPARRKGTILDLDGFRPARRPGGND